jgi:benzoate membrane transport protein
MSVLNAIFGGHPASMARTVTAIVSGREAGVLERRYWAAVIAFAGALSVALATGVIVAFIEMLPASFIAAVAGLALLAAFQDAMTRAFSGAVRLGAVIAFVVTLSSFTVAGIPSAFWALFAGIAISFLLEREELGEIWKGAFSSSGQPA